MKSVLIVEDEKAIRAGLCAMISRAPVEVEEILECKNGVEAWDILQNQPIDVMITDIRMPKMDGIELVQRARHLPSPPITVVISGYDDFDFAVNVFRAGVRDYILKPIERERVFELLQALQTELDLKELDWENHYAMNRHVLRSIILGGAGLADLSVIAAQFKDDLLKRGYFAICLSASLRDIPDEVFCYCFSDIGGQTLLLVPEPYMTELKQNLLVKRRAGLSCVKQSLEKLPEAYCEASQAYNYAFVLGGVADYANLPILSPNKKEGNSTAAPEQIVQLIGAGKADAAICLLVEQLSAVQSGNVSTGTFIDFFKQLLIRLRAAYSHIFLTMNELSGFENILSYDSAEEYISAFTGCLRRLSIFLAEDQKNQNIRKIQKAVDYITENYRSNINMAVVSNHISMNYSQFSNNFRQYTGKSFLDYLKNTRMEESKRLLADMSISIREVCEKSGFKNEKHFMRCFKQDVGVSPGDYRRNINNNQ
jgi:YesN/AraC family two-component response regulator